jgi:hypothetical protein
MEHALFTFSQGPLGSNEPLLAGFHDIAVGHLFIHMGLGNDSSSDRTLSIVKHGFLRNQQ